MIAYRYEDVRYAGLDEGDRGELRVELREYEIVKETPKGFWISFGFGSKRFVLNAATKRFACRTKEAAMESFRARKRRQIRIYSARLADAKLALTISEEIG